MAPAFEAVITTPERETRQRVQLRDRGWLSSGIGQAGLGWLQRRY